jgi:hypothetical protein
MATRFRHYLALLKRSKRCASRPGEDLLAAQDRARHLGAQQGDVVRDVDALEQATQACAMRSSAPASSGGRRWIADRNVLDLEAALFVIGRGFSTSDSGPRTPI